MFYTATPPPTIKEEPVSEQQFLCFNRPDTPPLHPIKSEWSPSPTPTPAITFQPPVPAYNIGRMPHTAVFMGYGLIPYPMYTFQPQQVNYQLQQPTSQLQQPTSQTQQPISQPPQQVNLQLPHLSPTAAHLSDTTAHLSGTALPMYRMWQVLLTEV